MAKSSTYVSRRSQSLPLDPKELIEHIVRSTALPTLLQECNVSSTFFLEFPTFFRFDLIPSLPPSLYTEFNT